VRCMPCLALLPCQAGPQLRPVFDPAPSQSGTFRNPNVSLSALEHHISLGSHTSRKHVPSCVNRRPAVQTIQATPQFHPHPLAQWPSGHPQLGPNVKTPPPTPTLAGWNLT
jgi:hypothetical protein